MAAKKRYSEESIVSALREMKGMVYLAAERVGCCADTIYERAKTSPAITEAMRHERGRFVDSAEMKLINAVDACEPWAIQMALKCLGKNRGYVERQEVTGRDGEPVQLLEVVVRTREEAKTLLPTTVERNGTAGH